MKSATDPRPSLSDGGPGSVKGNKEDVMKEQTSIREPIHRMGNSKERILKVLRELLNGSLTEAHRSTLENLYSRIEDSKVNQS